MAQWVVQLRPDHLPLFGRIIDRWAEEQVLANSTIEADFCKLLVTRSYLDVNVSVDDASTKVDFPRQSRCWIIGDTAVLETITQLHAIGMPFTRGQPGQMRCAF